MDNTVNLADVLIVLKAKDVAIACIDPVRRVYLLAGNGLVEEIIFTEPVHKTRLRDLSRRYNIPIHLFWNTQMLQYKPGDKPN